MNAFSGLLGGLSQASNKLPGLAQRMINYKMQQEQMNRQQVKAGIDIALRTNNFPAFQKLITQIDPSLAQNAQEYFNAERQKIIQESRGNIVFAPSGKGYYSKSGELLSDVNPELQASMDEYKKSMDKIYPQYGFYTTQGGQFKAFSDMEQDVITNAQNLKQALEYEYDKALADHKDMLQYDRQKKLQDARLSFQEKLTHANRLSQAFKYIDTQVSEKGMSPERAASYMEIQFANEPETVRKTLAYTAKTYASNRSIKAGLSPTQVGDIAELNTVQSEVDDLIGLLSKQSVKDAVGAWNGRLEDIYQSTTGKRGVSKDVVEFGIKLKNMVDLLVRERTGAQINEQEMELYKNMFGSTYTDPKAMARQLSTLIGVIEKTVNNTYVTSMRNRYGLTDVTEDMLEAIPRYKQRNFIDAPILR